MAAATAATIPHLSRIPAFPNGYNAFYIMKYCWFTAGQYADFLNTLTEAQYVLGPDGPGTD
jgi:hypothetical protein